MARSEQAHQFITVTDTFAVQMPVQSFVCNIADADFPTAFIYFQLHKHPSHALYVGGVQNITESAGRS